ncbi:MAG: coenzyme F420-0:L-glutamate ligase [Thermoproteota archaeon]|jgi:coenzyme F420-0:L-glutamate ligase/coenzyme F420-1:gamma-L-glutamate ligase|nr:coenzyme F420-0:L-glutamate ligase [Thermoproteota archaeon]|tara:strand:- start:376 stop:1113 length:738 start_codon:yes stop_codon:yes gene_type:complete
MSIRIIPVKLKNDVTPDDDIVELILSSNKKPIDDGDIIVVSQKIVSKQEGRTINLNSVIPSELSVGIASAYEKDPRLVEAILSESKRIVRMEHGVIIVETNHNFICANAGIDESNVEKDYATLLPVNPDRSAKRIRDAILQITGKNTAVIISDTFGRPFRLGQTDHAIGVAGIESIKNYEGKPDTFGKTMRVTAIAVVDELCGAAELVMGKTDKSPVVIIKNYNFESKNDNINSILRDKSEDLFR